MCECDRLFHGNANKGPGKVDQMYVDVPPRGFDHKATVLLLYYIYIYRNYTTGGSQSIDNVHELE